jgi:hypothetical protein
VQTIWSPWPQFLRPGGQTGPSGTQSPSTHHQARSGSSGVGPHAFPQRPQFEGSYATFVHVAVGAVPHTWFGARQSFTFLQTPDGSPFTVVGPQNVPPGQTVPHAPQFRGSYWRFVQMPPHIALPFVQPEVSPTQLPPLQKLPVGHLTPQSPQFRGSDATAVQTGRLPTVQTLLGVLQSESALQMPPEQNWEEVHFFPHVPQLFGSKMMFVQTLPPVDAGQTVFGQVATSRQRPSLQNWPAAQERPHMPQFDGSLRTFAQNDEAPEPQMTFGTSQPGLHSPESQYLPAPQPTPHAPQFAGS